MGLVSAWLLRHSTRSHGGSGMWSFCSATRSREKSWLAAISRARALPGCTLSLDSCFSSDGHSARAAAGTKAASSATAAILVTLTCDPIRTAYDLPERRLLMLNQHNTPRDGLNASAIVKQEWTNEGQHRLSGDG